MNILSTFISSIFPIHNLLPYFILPSVPTLLAFLLFPTFSSSVSSIFTHLRSSTFELCTLHSPFLFFSHSHFSISLLSSVHHLFLASHHFFQTLALSPPLTVFSNSVINVHLRLADAPHRCGARKVVNNSPSPPATWCLHGRGAATTTNFARVHLCVVYMYLSRACVCVCV